jgi:1,2-phenylacetyl-CoA epoxidase catalytic subunit
MDIIKKAIKSELKRRGWSHYRLAKELKGKLPERTLYSYLSDEQKSNRDISAQRASIILKELGLKVTR